MKNSIYTILAIILLAACQPEAETSVEKLNHEKDSLSTLQKELSLKIKELDLELLKLDSTKKLSTVTALTLETRPFKHFFKVYGVVESNQSINLYSEAAGKINSIKVKRGQNVAKGQLLAEIDGSILKNNIQEVKTSLQLANQIYNKQSKLWLEDNIGSEVQYLESKNNKESLERKLETLYTQLSKTKVRAPFSGVIDDIFPKVGEMSSGTSPMFRLVNLSDVYLTAAVSESYVGKVLSGTPALVKFSSINETLETEVVRVGNFINPNNRTFNVNVALSSNSNFKPNMMASVELEDYSTDSAIVVPSRVIIENTEGSSFVYLYTNPGEDISEVKKVTITRGVSYNGFTEVIAGLNKGDVVVDKGSRSIREGQRVRLTQL